MRKYILKRLLQSVVILFFVAFIIYALMRCLPTSYVEAMARQKSMQAGSKSYEEWMEQLTVMYNMDGSIISGFFKWLGSMMRGDFGDSWRWTVPVLQKFNDTVWLSFVMGLISLILEILFTHDPDDIPYLELTVWREGRQVLLSFLQTDNHTTVEVTDAALDKCLTNERTFTTNHKLA